MKICNQCGQTMDNSSKYCLRCGSGNLRTEGGGETITRKPISIGKGLGGSKKDKEQQHKKQQEQFDDWDDSGHYDGEENDGDELIEHNFKNPNAKVTKKKPKDKKKPKGEKAPKKKSKIALGRKSQTSVGNEGGAPSKQVKNAEYNQQNMGYMDDEQMEYQDNTDYDNSISGYGTAGDDDAVTVGEWVKTVIITAIPIYGLIRLISLAFGKKKYEKQSLRNWAQATIYLMGGSLVVLIILTLIKKILGNLF